MKPHVLVVDDSMIVRMDLRGALTAAGFDVTVCDTRRAAEDLLEQRSFSALILDVMLPDGDGVQILQRVRADSQHADTPVIMLSAEAEVRDRVRGLSMGADEYVGKPYNITYFISRVRDLCRLRREGNVSVGSVLGCRRILTVDDSRTYLEYLADTLRDEGHDVVLASSGLEALKMLAAQTIDCVVLDLYMPELDGLETVRRIRQTPGRESTPIMMLTESDEPMIEQEALDAGADAFMHKSATLDVINAKIRNVLRKRRTSANASEASSQTSTSMSGRSIPPGAMRKPSVSSAATADRAPAKEVNSLFVETASAMGLSNQLARDTLTKTLYRMNIDPRLMDHADLTRALPALRDALRMFFSPVELLPRIEAITSVATRARGRTG